MKAIGTDAARAKTSAVMLTEIVRFTMALTALLPHRPACLPVRTRRVALVHPGAWAGQFLGAGSGVPRHVQTRPVVGPIDQPVFEHRVGSGNALRHGHGMPYLAR